MLAVRNSDTLTMTSLVGAGASVIVRDSTGDTVIHHAARVGHLQAIEILPIQASDFEMKNSQGERPLHIACSKPQRMIVSALLERGAQVNAWTEPSNSKQRMFSKPTSDAKTLALPATPFHLACFYGHYDCAVILMRHGAWLHATLEDTRTPLMLAVQSHNPHLVSLLLEKGAKVNAATSKECLTALHFACYQGDLEITKMLISYGANTFALTTHNPPETPASYAYKWISPPPGGKIDTDKWAAADFAAATSTNMRSAKMGFGPQHSLPDEGPDFYQPGLLDPNGYSAGPGLVSPGFQPISANQPQSFRASSARSSF
jgi:ankyrin repeat protein